MGSATGCLTKKTKETCPSEDRGAASCLQALVLMEDFNQPNSVGRTIQQSRLSRRFLECLDEYLLPHITDKPVRRGAVGDPILTNKERAGGESEAQGLQ